MAEAVLTLWRWVADSGSLDPTFDDNRGRCYEKSLSFSLLGSRGGFIPQERRVLNGLRRRRNRVPEADVDLEIDPPLPEPRSNFTRWTPYSCSSRIGSTATVAAVNTSPSSGTSSARANGRPRKDPPDCSDRTQADRVPASVDELTRPEREQHGAFHHEPWGVLRPGQLDEEPLHRIPRQQPLEFLPTGG